MNWFIKLAAYKFSSTQINLPKDLANRIILWCKKNIKEADVFKGEENTGRESEPHITVLYGIHTESPKQVEKLISGFGSFQVTLGEINRFTKNDDFDVLKIKVESNKLKELHKLLADNIDNSDKFPIYTPHSTICYINKGTNIDLVGNREFFGTKIKVSEIIFSPKGENKEKVTISLD